MNPFNKNKQKRIITPIVFGEDIVEKPISFFDKEITTETSFAILKTTDGGRYMRGDMLFYSLNGVEVYTESNNIIFVDTENNTMFIKEYSKVIREISPEDPETRQYIILYKDIDVDDSSYPLRWESVQGRTNTYETIKVNAPVLDVDKSIVIVENVPIKDCLSVREFVKYVQNANMVESDDFDIDMYANTEYL